MINTMWRLLAQVVTGVLLALTAVTVTAGPAQAGGSCSGSAGAAGRPAALTGGRMALWNVKSTGYRGTPFSFRMFVQRGGFPVGTDTYVYTYDNWGGGYRHSMTTGGIRAGMVVKVQTWCDGRRGADWTGRVRTR